ncbi:NAD(P)-dependent oxidoreductase [Sphingomonas endophytica]|uniref:3-hydroxyisobutyrate dehydrogenase n=1 Tax=Sphingomonas endophytica TaxID=869719 RepID=A0A147I4X6_9SPHN|nr:NAD(P)-dependent oxidoreductase [Sphingomonas endophytica]KTT73557.1 3-hydroxyisobutyrate dehydrogenase [Sphingomonas endophytica]
MTTKVTILGTGIMGSGMARRLLDRGVSVTVWNRNAARAAPLAAAGATIASTPGEAAARADIVVAMLADDDASRGVWLGESGAFATMRAGAIAVECSTLTHGWIATLATEAATRGIGLIDAPVTGSRAQAAAGELRFLVGGDAATVDGARPVLALLGVETIHLGPSGSGAMLKLLNNFLCGVQVAALAEAVAAIERSGLDPDAAFRVIRTGAPGSPLVNAVGDRMMRRAYEPHFLVPLMAKDLDYAARAMKELGVDSLMAAPARSRFQTAAGQGHDGDDIAAIVEPLR